MKANWIGPDPWTENLRLAPSSVTAVELTELAPSARGPPHALRLHLCAQGQPPSNEVISGAPDNQHDYDEYMRLKGLATHALKVTELSDEAVAALAEARMDARHDPLNARMDD